MFLWRCAQFMKEGLLFPGSHLAGPGPGPNVTLRDNLASPAHTTSRRDQLARSRAVEARTWRASPTPACTRTGRLRVKDQVISPQIPLPTLPLDFMLMEQPQCKGTGEELWEGRVCAQNAPLRATSPAATSPTGAAAADHLALLWGKRLLTGTRRRGQTSGSDRTPSRVPWVLITLSACRCWQEALSSAVYFIWSAEGRQEG